MKLPFVADEDLVVFVDIEDQAGFVTHVDGHMDTTLRVKIVQPDNIEVALDSVLAMAPTTINQVFHHS